MSRSNVVDPGGTDHLVDLVTSNSSPLVDGTDLQPVMDAIGDARYVLIGEASHGTREFYEWRARLTRRLVAEKGFRIVAVEGDWPDCRAVNRFVRDPAADDAPSDVLRAFDRWPTWMWANHEVAGFTAWLHEHNRSLPARLRTGFYGVDLYSLWESLHAVTAWVEDNAPEAVEAARGAYRCFEPYGEDAQEYGRATAFVPETCEDEVASLLAELRARANRKHPDDAEGRFDAEMNALVLRDAERYYRAMMRGGPSSWNIRDRHMVDTIERLVDHAGPGARCVVWAHNTHVGDARATDMERDGLVNVGQLLRDAHDPDDVYIVGMGSFRGDVVAARAWDAPTRFMQTPPARQDSWEEVFHRAGPEDRLLLMDDFAEDEVAGRPRGHRAIGVVYNPAHDAWANYVPTVLPERYDAFLSFDQTRALRPLGMPRPRKHEEDTYPFGL